MANHQAKQRAEHVRRRQKLHPEPEVASQKIACRAQNS